MNPLLPKRAQSLSFSESDIPIREFIERIVDERDRQYDMRFRAAEIAVQAALLAQKELTASSFAASEKAIIKAEEAQRDYNQRSNEFRGQLDDQAKMLMPRVEVIGLFKGIDDKFIFVQQSFDNRLETQRLSIEKNADGTLKSLADVRLAMTHFLTLDAYETRHGELQRQVNELRELRSQAGGKTSGTQATMGTFFAVGAIIVSLTSALVAIILHFI
jgi:hypothetical protein